MLPSWMACVAITIPCSSNFMTQSNLIATSLIPVWSRPFDILWFWYSLILPIFHFWHDLILPIFHFWHSPNLSLLCNSGILPFWYFLILVWSSFSDIPILVQVNSTDLSFLASPILPLLFNYSTVLPFQHFLISIQSSLTDILILMQVNFIDLSFLA